MLYIMYKNGILEEDRRKLLAHARITLEENDALNNLLLFGVKLIKPSKGVKKGKKYRQKPSDGIQYEISRYKPKLKIVLENHINNQIDHTAYPYTKDPTGDPDGLKGTQQAPVSLRSARAGWFKKGQAENRLGRIIVFVAGGVTYSELRSAYEISERDVVIGSTHIITPKQFVDDLKVLIPPRNYPVQPSILPQIPPHQGVPNTYNNNLSTSPYNKAPSSGSNNYPQGSYIQTGQQQQQYSAGYSVQSSYQQRPGGYSPSGYPQSQSGYQQPQGSPYQGYGQPAPTPNQQYIQKPSSTSSSTSSNSSKPKSKNFFGLEKYLS